MSASATESGDREDESAESEGGEIFERCGAIARRSAVEFWWGSIHVHQNYLDLWGTILAKLAFLIPVAALFFAGTVLLPNNTSVRFVSDSLRSLLERILMLIKVPTEGLMFVFYIPFELVMAMIKGVIAQISGGFSIRARTLCSAGSSLRNFLPRDKYICGPLREEVAIRFVFWRLWKLTTNQEERSSDLSNTERTIDGVDAFQSVVETRHIIRGRPTWTIVSSFIFAGAHLANHLPVASVARVADFQEKLRVAGAAVSRREHLEKADMDKFSGIVEFIGASVEHASRYNPVIKSMIQGITSFILSTVLLCPVFISNGIMGSFGAHAAWNIFLSYPSPFHQIFMRLLIRKIQDMGKNKMELRK